MLVCARWYAAYPLSFGKTPSPRHLEEMRQERGVFVDHCTVHCWSLKMLPVLVLIFRSRKRPVGISWRLDETYMKVASQWKYLNHIVAQDHRAVKRMTDPMHMVKKGQLYCPGRQAMPSANQFYSLAGQAGLNVLNLLPTPPRTRRSGAPTTAHTRRLGPAVAHGWLLRRCARRPAR